MKPIAEQSDGPDRGTPELRRKHLIAEIPTEAAGIMAAQVLEECLLDSLFRRGKLTRSTDRTPEQVRRRYDAGLWLRKLYERIGLRTRSTMAYSAFGMGGRAFSDFIEMGPEEDDDDRREPLNWNWKCWRETLQGIGHYQHVLVAVCCMDCLPAYRSGDLRRALDRLADVRGM